MEHPYFNVAFASALRVRQRVEVQGTGRCTFSTWGLKCPAFFHEDVVKAKAVGREADEEGTKRFHGRRQRRFCEKTIASAIALQVIESPSVELQCVRTTDQLGGRN